MAIFVQLEGICRNDAHVAPHQPQDTSEAHEKQLLCEEQFSVWYGIAIDESTVDLSKWSEYECENKVSHSHDRVSHIHSKDVVARLGRIRLQKVGKRGAE